MLFLWTVNFNVPLSLVKMHWIKSFFQSCYGAISKGWYRECNFTGRMEDYFYFRFDYDKWSWSLKSIDFHIEKSFAKIATAEFRIWHQKNVHLGIRARSVLKTLTNNIFRLSWKHWKTRCLERDEIPEKRKQARKKTSRQT